MDAMNDGSSGPDAMSAARPPGAPEGTGHRDRLRQKFLNGGLAAFLDYEIVELLLTLGTPRRDCKRPAREALGNSRPSAASSRPGPRTSSASPASAPGTSSA